MINEQTTDEGPSEEIKMLEKASNNLGEFFDTVQIFCTRQHGDQLVTKSFNSGVGNFYARWGQIHEWMIAQDERVREHERQDEE